MAECNLPIDRRDLLLWNSPLIKGLDSNDDLPTTSKEDASDALKGLTPIQLLVVEGEPNSDDNAAVLLTSLLDDLKLSPPFVLPPYSPMKRSKSIQLLDAVDPEPQLKGNASLLLTALLLDRTFSFRFLLPPFSPINAKEFNDGTMVSRSLSTMPTKAVTISSAIKLPQRYPLLWMKMALLPSPINPLRKNSGKGHAFDKLSSCLLTPKCVDEELEQKNLETDLGVNALCSKIGKQLSVTVMDWLTPEAERHAPRTHLDSMIPSPSVSARWLQLYEQRPDPWAPANDITLWLSKVRDILDMEPPCASHCAVSVARPQKN